MKRAMEVVVIGAGVVGSPIAVGGPNGPCPIAIQDVARPMARRWPRGSALSSGSMFLHRVRA